MNADMRRGLGIWLLACALLTGVVIVSGGVTRLMGSGLSIVEWRPVTGILPPLSDAAWEGEFGKYRGSPEYREVNAGMGLAAFKAIYRLEYAHRMLGRAAALAFVVPPLILWLRGRLDRALAPRLVLLAGLWGCQGALGWYMVASGLVAEPRVSHLRLTAHLMAGCALFALLFATALPLLRPPEPDAAPSRRLRALCAAGVALVLVVIASGGLVAGLRAGLVYNTFPRMAGYWVPPFMLAERPLAANFVANVVTVQFQHRVLALLAALGAISAYLAGRRLGGRGRRALRWPVAAAALQAALGALTLVQRVPVPLGAAHQGMALGLLAAALYARHEILSDPR